jgi:succinate dehydrogenase / fumarate reductase, flavoprotein subunit
VVHEKLQRTMQDYVGIVRNADDLQTALDQLRDLRTLAAQARATGNVQFNPGWHLALDLDNMLDISEVVTRAALMRQESRGAHTRDDFPNSDPQWGMKNILVRLSGGQIELEQRPLPEMPEELRKLIGEPSTATTNPAKPPAG